MHSKYNQVSHDHILILQDLIDAQNICCKAKENGCDAAINIELKRDNKKKNVSSLKLIETPVSLVDTRQQSIIFGR